MTVLNLRSVEDTTLWKRLHSGFHNTEWAHLASALAPALLDVCRDAGDAMKAVPIHMPQYTLHDQVHLLRVTELMSKVLGKVLSNLNPVEITLLILSAHFHDHGMILESDEINGLETNNEFILHRENWTIDHPNLDDIRNQLKRRDLSAREAQRYRQQEADLQRAMLTDYIRITHAKRSRTFVNSTYATDKRWTALGTNLVDLVGRLCESHGMPVDWMNETNGFHDDRSVGTAQVNMRYLGLVLRLADILDLDRDRTPDLLYRAIHFTNQVSINEWEKHRAVEGWTITPSMIRFTMEFTHPVYERTARRFMDWIDDELAASHRVVRSFSSSIANNYRLDLPERVTRDRLGPKENAYRYHELEFSLSRDEIIKLLMTENLYGNPALAIRELIQNSMDALRYRRALHTSAGSNCQPGIVRLEHDIDANGHEVLRCIDNGVGMDETIITRFLTRAGRSFYRSPEFEQERIRFRSANVDFDPCARFGIGFMSCFMLGDHIIVKTRRDLGPQRGYGEPLIVEINGLGGILVIRQGPHDQPIGTSVEITGRQKPGYLDKWEDRVRLIRVVDGYALATEFPIEAYCRIPEIKGALKIPAEIARRKTPVEALAIKNHIILEQDFGDLDPRLRGTVRVGFLTDTASIPTLSNNEAGWQMRKEGSRTCLRLADGTIVDDHEILDGTGAICIDGMLVCGKPGRKFNERRSGLGWRNETVSLPFPYLVDIRGEIKPVLTPARLPADTTSTRTPSWRRIQKLMWQTAGRLWEQLVEYMPRGMSNETFWELTELNRASLHMMRFGAIWSRISVPLISEAGSIAWIRISSLGSLSCKPRVAQKGWDLFDANNGRVVHHAGMDQWVSSIRGRDPDAAIRTLVVLMSTLVLDGNHPAFVLLPPKDDNRSPCEYLMSSGSGFREYPIPFGGGLAGALAACNPLECVNRDHPLIREAIESELVEHQSDLQVFARGCVSWLSDPDTAKLIVEKSLPRIWRGLKWLGHQYQAVDWTRVAKELHPPYKIWCEPYGILEVSEKHFSAWAESPVAEEVDEYDDS